MNDQEQERFENELRRLQPASPPPEFITRLMEAQPTLRNRPASEPSRRFEPWWLPMLRWLAPATALVMAFGALWHWTPANHDVSPASALKADDVQIDRELVSTFDAVTKLPTGEPVRFRCRQWMDQVVLRDNESGVVIQQRTPRVEVVPVRFETY